MLWAGFTARAMELEFLTKPALLRNAGLGCLAVCEKIDLLTLAGEPNLLTREFFIVLIARDIRAGPGWPTRAFGELSLEVYLWLT